MKKYSLLILLLALALAFSACGQEEAAGNGAAAPADNDSTPQNQGDISAAPPTDGQLLAMGQITAISETAITLALFTDQGQQMPPTQGDLPEGAEPPTQGDLPEGAEPPTESDLPEGAEPPTQGDFPEGAEDFTPQLSGETLTLTITADTLISRGGEQSEAAVWSDLSVDDTVAVTYDEAATALTISPGFTAPAQSAE